MMNLLPSIFAITIYISVTVSDDIPCAVCQTEFGAVCVCNATYCDTVERPPPLTRGSYYRYTTSSDNPGFHRTTGHFSEGHPKTDNGSIVFTVNPNIKHQEIFGFGGAFTDSAAIVFNSLPPDAQNKFIESYFSKNGIEYSMGRIPIGASDFSPRLYTYDDVPNDEDLKYFNLTEEDFNYKFPLIKNAMSVSPHGIKMVGSTFSAPKWMKTNDTWPTAYVLEKSFDVWAKYHIKTLKAYEDNGIKMWAMTGGNQVLFDLVWHGVMHLGTLEMPHDHVRWFRDYLVPQLAATNYSDIKLLIMDDVRFFTDFWMSRFAQDSKAYKLVDGIGIHWYLDFAYPDDVYNQIAEEFHNSYPDKFTLYTESSVNGVFKGQHVEPGSWKRGCFYMYSIMKNLILWTSGYIDWNLALNMSGGPTLKEPIEAAILVNASIGEFYKNPIFYALGHFSKFIPPGSIRVDVQSNKNTTETRPIKPLEKLIAHIFHDSSRASFERNEESTQHFSRFPLPVLPHVVLCLATVNSDGSSTVIVLNSMDSDVNVTIVDTVSGYITTTVIANSLNTFVFWPN